MGWINWIVVPDLKVMFEVNRDFTVEDDDTDSVKLIEELMEYQSELSDTYYTKIKDLMLNDVLKMVNVLSKLNICPHEHLKNLFFLSFIKEHGLNYEIMTEITVQEHEDEYKEYKRIHFKE